MLRVDLLCTVRVWVGEMRMEGNEIKKSFELLQRESASFCKSGSERYKSATM